MSLLSSPWHVGWLVSTSDFNALQPAISAGTTFGYIGCRESTIVHSLDEFLISDSNWLKIRESAAIKQWPFVDRTTLFAGIRASSMANQNFRASEEPDGGVEMAGPTGWSRRATPAPPRRTFRLNIACAPVRDEFNAMFEGRTYDCTIICSPALLDWPHSTSTLRACWLQMSNVEAKA